MRSTRLGIAVMSVVLAASSSCVVVPEGPDAAIPVTAQAMFTPMSTTFKVELPIGDDDPLYKTTIEAVDTTKALFGPTMSSATAPTIDLRGAQSMVFASKYTVDGKQFVTLTGPAVAHNAYVAVSLDLGVSLANGYPSSRHIRSVHVFKVVQDSKYWDPISSVAYSP